MLVLSRKKNERVVLNVNGVQIVVVVVRIDGDRTRIGFDAPKEVHIVRGELEGKAA